MTRYPGLERPQTPDWEGLVENIRRKGTPRRVHHIELFHDVEIVDAIVERFGLAEKLNATGAGFARGRYIALQRFLGFDHISVNLAGMEFPLNWKKADDPTRKDGHRNFLDEQAGPIANWEQFEKYPWPDPGRPEATAELEWCQANLPDDMCIISHTGHFAEYLTWLMGYANFCFALYEQRDLVEAIARKIMEFHIAEVRRVLQFDRVMAIWGSDDMGFRGGLLFSPADMRRFVLPGHKTLAKMAHDAGRLYLLHSCGKLQDIMPDLLDDVKLDGKHSFEDTIEDVREAKNTWGRKAAMLGGIDVDFLCRSDASAIRRRVRDVLDKCLPGGGYCLGTGNSVANYIPLDNYLAMVDEGRLYSA